MRAASKLRSARPPAFASLPTPRPMTHALTSFGACHVCVHGGVAVGEVGDARPPPFLPPNLKVVGVQDLVGRLLLLLDHAVKFDVLGLPRGVDRHEGYFWGLGGGAARAGGVGRGEFARACSYAWGWGCGARVSQMSGHRRGGMRVGDSAGTTAWQVARLLTSYVERLFETPGPRWSRAQCGRPLSRTTSAGSTTWNHPPSCHNCLAARAARLVKRVS